MSSYLDTGPAGVGATSVTPVTAGDLICEMPDIRLERATATEVYDTRVRPPRRWFNVIYLADDGHGH